MSARLQRCRFDNTRAASSALADEVAAALHAVDLKRSGVVRLIVPGGRTPSVFLSALARRPLDWSGVCVMATDEPMVPADHPDRTETVLRRDLATALEAGAGLITFLPDTPSDGDAAYAFDMDEAERFGDARTYSISEICVLGFGEDGHIASLFPGLSGLAGAGVVTVEVASSKPPLARVSFTLPRLAAADLRVLLGFGARKRAVLDEPAPDAPIARLTAQASVLAYSD